MVRDVVMSRFRIARGVNNRQSYLASGGGNEGMPAVYMHMEGGGAPPVLTRQKVRCRVLLGR